MRPTLAAAVLAAAALLLPLAGCGGDAEPGVAQADDGPASTTSGASTTTAGADGDAPADPQDAALEFARCMRGQGVDFPDPQPDADGRLRIQIGAGPGTDAEAMREAAEACERFLPGGEAPDPDDPELMDARLEFARCMREHGIDVPDPEPSAGRSGGVMREGPGGADPDDPRVQEAIEACAREGGGDMVLQRRSEP